MESLEEKVLRALEQEAERLGATHLVEQVRDLISDLTEPSGKDVFRMQVPKIRKALTRIRHEGPQVSRASRPSSIPPLDGAAA